MLLGNFVSVSVTKGNAFNLETRLEQETLLSKGLISLGGVIFIKSLTHPLHSSSTMESEKTAPVRFQSHFA